MERQRGLPVCADRVGFQIVRRWLPLLPSSLSPTVQQPALVVCLCAGQGPRHLLARGTFEILYDRPEWVVGAGMRAASLLARIAHSTSHKQALAGFL